MAAADKVNSKTIQKLYRLHTVHALSYVITNPMALYLGRAESPTAAQCFLPLGCHPECAKWLATEFRHPSTAEPR